MCCHKNVCDLRLKKWKCRGDLWNVSLFRGVFYYLHRACLHIQHSLSPLLMPGTAHSTHTHTLLNPVYLSWTKCDTSGTSLSYPPSWWKVHWYKYHSHTQLHVGKKHTSDRPPSIVPHLQQTTSPFPWQHDCCGVPATGVPERQVTAGSDSHSWVRLRNITRCE